MAYVCYCDKCNRVIKDKEPRQTLVYTEPITKKEKNRLIEEYVNNPTAFGKNIHKYSLNSQLDKLKEKVICIDCVKILNKFFNLKKKEVTKILEKLESMYEEGDENE